MFLVIRYVLRMDYDYAIERHRQPLLAIVATLYAMIGLTEGGSMELPWMLYRKVLSLLRPAESAVRRLIVVMAHGLVVEPPVSRSVAKRRAKSGKGERQGKGRRRFSLFDPRLRQDAGLSRRRFSAAVPRAEPAIHIFDERLGRWRSSSDSPVPPPPAKPARPDTVNAASLCGRLAALKRALEDLGSEAMRYARWRAKAEAASSPKLDTVLRRGPPPGLRRTSSHEVHEILKDCHWLARNPPKPKPDTS